MKHSLLLTVFLFGSILCAYGQKKITFEQVAFEYYRDSVFKHYKGKDKIKISKTPIADYSYWNVKCLKEFALTINDTAAGVTPSRITGIIDIGDDNRFELKKFKKNKSGQVFVTPVLSFETGQNIVALIENLDGTFVTYLFDITGDGKIKKWRKERLMIE
ncbi:hypothetical protein NAT51_05115 [Flavobacterium amniphilum]|uniref:hypothetical protein n=1 Tax=Flavobacterium amniphilum TaxID=1834035 RepID=UPI002029CF00|nr:hypothetical protein [Flavobacterium amniphilum]MCL9804888.1 hypothetical protein [Flavobacterium amniphilum]